MANEAYTGVPTVTPDVRQPDDYQRIQSSPANFGADIAQGAEKLGAGASTAAKFWGQTQTDQVLNDALQQGDTAVQQYKTLRGGDAVSAKDGVFSQLDSIGSSAKELLKTPEQQLEFDRQFRPFRDRLWAGQVATHLDSQAYEHAKTVNNDSFTQAINQIATVADNPAEVERLKGAARAALIKQVYQDGQENDRAAVKSAWQRADSATYKTAAEVRAVKDPLGAQEYINQPKVKAGLGAAWAPLAEQLRARADQQQSVGDAAAVSHQATTELAQNATPPVPGTIRKANEIPEDMVGPAAPSSGGTTPTPTAAQQKAATTAAAAAPQFHQTSVSMDQLFHAFHGQESGGGANTTTSIDNAHGDMQIQPATFAAYAKPGEKLDNPTDNIAVGKRILADYNQRYGGDSARVAVAYFSGPGNVAPAGSPTPWLHNSHDGQGTYVSQYVSGILGRLGHPTPSYPSPSRGEEGFVSRPGWEGATPATDATPETTPTPEVTPAAFTPAVTVTGTPQPPPAPPTPEDILARAVQIAQARTDRTAPQKELIVRQLQQAYAAAALATETTAKAKKEQTNTTVDEYMKRIISGDTDGMVEQLSQDPRLNQNPEARKSLWELAVKASGQESPAIYGKGFDDVYKRILLPPGDPQRLSDPVDVLELGGKGGPLTFAGTQKALTVMKEAQKSVDGYGIQMTKSGAVSNAKKYLSFEEDNGFVKIRDPDGERIFDTQFLPMFESAYDDWVMKKGRDPHEFPLFEPKKMDALLQKLRPKSARDQARMNATGEEAPNAPLPPPPEGVNPVGWTTVVSQPPTGKNGPISHVEWANKVARLAADPAGMSPLWDASQFGRSGLKAQDVLRRLGLGQPEATPLTPTKAPDWRSESMKGE